MSKEIDELHKIQSRHDPRYFHHVECQEQYSVIVSDHKGVGVISVVETEFGDGVELRIANNVASDAILGEALRILLIYADKENIPVEGTG